MKEVDTMFNYTNRYAIHYTVSTPNHNTYANANKFIRTLIVCGSMNTLREKVQNLLNEGAKIKCIRNGVGGLVEI
jgi:hypothetical protein